MGRLFCWLHRQRAFTVGGAPIARDAAVIEAGLDFALTSAATLGVTYGGRFESGVSDRSVKANFNVKSEGGCRAISESRSVADPRRIEARRGEVPLWRPRKLLFAPPRLPLSALDKNPAVVAATDTFPRSSS
ncbi:hypothetical protein QFZ88_003616 [Mesorhizobium sp. YL-MeA3-2017]|jgi:hypothetical protein|nr:hypothetical protein [Mesorhizobium sp. YL-MeA3-2017]